jgi:hypothetical protein
LAFRQLRVPQWHQVRVRGTHDVGSGVSRLCLNSVRGRGIVVRHDVTSRAIEGNFQLGNWVSVQRYRKELVPTERKRRLDAIGFVWDWRDYFWEQNFAALLKFKRREGHCRVPSIHREGDLKLGLWATTQRRKRKTMLAERRARLNKIGFVWNPPVGPTPYRPEASRPVSAPNSPRPRA